MLASTSRAVFLPRLTLLHLARPLSSSAVARSHVGSTPVQYPSAVRILLPNAGSEHAIVSGPLGQLCVKIWPFLTIEKTAAAVTNAPPSTTLASPVTPHQVTLCVQDASVKHQRAIWGLTRSLLANAVHGVSTGYTLALRLVGVGYRATLEAVPVSASSAPPPSGERPPTQRLNLKLGFAHPVLIDVPADVLVSTPSTTVIELRGIDKQRLGEVAARIRRWRVPEPYNVSPFFLLGCIEAAREGQPS